ncbi:MAG: T9SS type A sorting domain-containing protein [Bacteroidetes bacterium]|nr:T9SS type A sorting domain-containing protein [Bacteroidota bacterium]
MKYIFEFGALLFSLSSFGQWSEVHVDVSDEWYKVETFENEVIFLLAMNKVAKSTDGGANWIYYSPSHAGYFTGMTFINAQTGWLSSSFGEIVFTNDSGANWTIIQTVAAYWKDIFFINNTHGWASSNAGEIFKTIDGGSNWTKEFQKTGEIAENVFFTDELNGWFCTYEGSSFRTTDGGYSWTEIINQSVYRVYFSNQLNGWGVDYFGNVLKTSDGGIYWDIMSTNFSWQLSHAKYISAYEGWAVGGSDCSGGICIPYHKILYTKDGGQTWSSQDVSTATSNMRINDIDFINTGNNNYSVYVCGGKGKLWVNHHQLSSIEKSLVNSRLSIKHEFDNIRLESEETIDRIDIMNLEGKIIQSFTEVRNNSISTQQLGQGGYILAIYLQDGIDYYKFIK